MIGVESLGSLFTDGFQRGIQAEIVTGIVATIVLALAPRLGVRAGRPPAHAVVAAERRWRGGRRVARVERVDAA